MTPAQYRLHRCAAPVPVEPETELAGLLREYLAIKKNEGKLEQKIEKLMAVA